MSLINDALKRAKQAQSVPPPAEISNLHLKPVEPIPYARHSLGVLVPAALTLAALLILFLVWQRYASHEVADRDPSASGPTLVVQAKSSAPAAPAATTPDVTPSPAQPAVTPPQPAAAPGPKPAATGTAAPAMIDTPASNPPAISEPPAEKPAPLKLQGIVFSLTRPSAVINGKTVFIGDRVRDFRVVAISKDSATLSNSHEQQVLSLDQ